MEYFRKAIYYFNYYLLGYRYNVKLEEFFKNPYNNTILKLYKEGYDVGEKFFELQTQYESR